MLPVDIRQIGIERNEEQKRALGKMWFWIGVGCVGILSIPLFGLLLDGLDSFLTAVFAGVGSVLYLCFFLFITTITGDLYRESYTATPEQLKEYAAKNDKYVGKTYFENDEEE